MTQCMDAWIVADPSALAAYYGNGFRMKALPVRGNLEEEARSDIAAKLNAATRDTKTKGAYHKTRYAPDLLARIDPQTVRDRCPHCDRMFMELAGLIG
ncbi:MAG: DUF4276 family protein [Phycisphaerales bacterium]|nr:DUF4276 family protein [Phycisphaerales bacterium]